MNHYKTFLLFLLGTSMLTACQTAVEEKERHPNILFIFADDMGYGDPSCFNPKSQIPTPNIDQLATSGMRFTDAHAPAALCVQSRYALLTGQYAFLNDRKYEDGIIEPGRPTIASVLRTAGYHTGMIGKWHQGIVQEKDPPAGEDLAGGPLDHGFDEFFGMPASLDIQPYYYIKDKQPVALPSDTTAGVEGTAPAPGKRKIQGPFYRAGKVAPNFKHEEVLDRFKDEAISYLQRQAKQEKPFFLYLALPAPHTPWLPNPAFQGKSKVGTYGDFVLQVDDLVGQLLNTLEESGVSEETIVFFSSDNGPVWYPENVTAYRHNSVGPLSGMKGDALEGGHRLPFIVKWPGKVQANTVNPNLISFTDLLATFAELTDTRIDDQYRNNSLSFLPLMLDPGHAPTRQVFAMQSAGNKYAIRKAGWKLIQAKGTGGFSDGYDPTIAEKNPYEMQLYNLETDIGEQQNLYGEQSEKVAELEKELGKILETRTMSNDR